MAAPERQTSEPALVPDGLGWRFSPAQAPVTFTFSRLVERSAELTAELHVEKRGGDPRERHVMRRRVNLLGTNTPKTLASDLDTATDGAGWPWRAIVEQAFGSVIEAHRAGERVRLLGGKRTPPPPVEHLADGILVAHVPNTWFGPGGTGKSTAAIAACAAHAEGLPFAGLEMPRGVPLYLDWEDEAEAFERVLWEVSRGYGRQESVRVYWRGMRSPLSADLAYISSLITELGVTLLVIDSATRAMGAAGEHGTYESTAVSFAEAIRQLRPVTILIIDHVDGAAVKDGGPAKKAYGSIHKMNFVRNAWSLTLDEEAAVQTVGWTHPKSNHGPRRQPFGLVYERDPVVGGLELRRIAAEQVSPIVERMTLAARIASTLRESGPLSVRQIAEAVLGAGEKKDVETIRKTLNRDLGKRFRSYSDGTWVARGWRQTGPPDTARQSRQTPDIRLVNVGREEPDELPY